MASPNLTELVATTLRNRKKVFADNVSKGNALLARMENLSDTVKGGRTIVQELEYAENTTFKYYSGYETLDIAPSEVFDAAEYPWKQAACNVSFSGLEVNVQTVGKEAMLDLTAKRIKNAMTTFRNNVSIGIYSDGTGSSSKQITGLQAQVADDPTTGTVGGIDRSSWAFWRNQYNSVSDASSTTIQGYMNAMWLACIRGSDKPNIIIADANMYTYYWESLQAIQRINQAETGVAGFTSLDFMGAPVVYDGDSGISADHMYFLNTDYIHWRPSANVNMDVDNERRSVNQDAYVIPILWAGNLTMSNASLQGVIVDTA